MPTLTGARRKHGGWEWWQLEARRFTASLAPECQLLEQAAVGVVLSGCSQRKRGERRQIRAGRFAAELVPDRQQLEQRHLLHAVHANRVAGRQRRDQALDP